MDEHKRALLEGAGIDVEEALGRFLGNEALLLKFLKRFPGDGSFPQLRQALGQGELQTAFEAAHTLKGVAGNLSLGEFYRQVFAVVELLRAGRLEHAAAQLPELDAKYSRLVEAIALLG